MKFNLATAIAAPAAFLIVLPSQAATLVNLNQNVFKFNTGTPESELQSSSAARINLGDTTIYIGTNQVSAINQDPIVTSFTNGVRNWTQSYDTSAIDARGMGLLYDEGSASLYGVFTADGGSQGANTFGAATQGGWLSGYGRGGGPMASVLLKLNPSTGAVEDGTFIRAQTSDGNTNTLRPTNLDFVNGEVVFYGDSFFSPLGTNGNPFDSDARTTDEGSPFDYRVVLSADLSDATSAEAIGWNGLTAFSPLAEETGETDDVDEDDGSIDVGDEVDDDVDDADDDEGDNDDAVDDQADDDGGADDDDGGADDDDVGDEVDDDDVDDADSGDTDDQANDDGTNDVDNGNVDEGEDATDDADEGSAAGDDADTGNDVDGDDMADAGDDADGDSSDDPTDSEIADEID
ncbi:MAG: hypothetical protein AAF722_06805, partial [Cyanobacteria bacterium P01_C01_bin.70]